MVFAKNLLSINCANMENCFLHCWLWRFRKICKYTKLLREQDFVCMGKTMQKEANDKTFVTFLSDDKILWEDVARYWPEWKKVQFTIVCTATSQSTIWLSQQELNYAIVRYFFFSIPDLVSHGLQSDLSCIQGKVRWNVLFCAFLQAKPQLGEFNPIEERRRGSKIFNQVGAGWKMSQSERF